MFEGSSLFRPTRPDPTPPLPSAMDLSRFGQCTGPSWSLFRRSPRRVLSPYIKFQEIVRLVHSKNVIHTHVYTIVLCPLSVRLGTTSLPNGVG